MKKFTFLILGLFLCQNILALSASSSFADIEAYKQRMANERPDTYARVMRAFGHRDVSMDSATRSCLGISNRFLSYILGSC